MKSDLFRKTLLAEAKRHPLTADSIAEPNEDSMVDVDSHFRRYRTRRMTLGLHTIRSMKVPYDCPNIETFDRGSHEALPVDMVIGKKEAITRKGKAVTQANSLANDLHDRRSATIAHVPSVLDLTERPARLHYPAQCERNYQGMVMRDSDRVVMVGDRRFGRRSNPGGGNAVFETRGACGGR